MEYRNKIIKYKLKNIKMENKIHDLVIKKKNLYLKFIDKTIANISIISDIMNQLENNQKSQEIYIIVTGIYGVGKSSIVKILINLLGNKINLNLNLNENNYEQIINQYISNTNISNTNTRLILIEININLLNLLLKKIENNKFYIINIIPENIQSYKNKLINKIFIDIKSNSNNFILNTKTIYDDIQYIHSNIYKIINSEKYVLSNNDFNFIDKIVIKLMNNGKLYKIENSIYEILDIEF